MRRFVAFLLGIITGIVLVVGGVAGAAWYGVAVLKPSQIDKSANTYMGDLADKSLYDMYNQIISLYNEKTGKVFDDKYFTLGDYLDENNVNIDSLNKKLGVTIPDSVLDIPLFEFFRDGDGVNNALAQIQVSTLPDIVNMFSGNSEDSGKIVNQDAVDNMTGSIADLLDESKGIAYVFENVKLVQLLPNNFPSTADENAVTYALGQCAIGKVVSALSGGESLFVQLKNPIPGTDEAGAFATIGSLKFTELLGDTSTTIKAIFGNNTLADIVDDEGNINPDEMITGVKIGSLLGYTYNETEGKWYNDSTVADGLYANLADITVGDIMSGDALTNLKIGMIVGYTRKNLNDISEYTINKDIIDADGNSILLVREKIDGSIAIAKPSDDEPTWYEGKLSCENTDSTHQHDSSCYQMIWYTDDACTTTSSGIIGKFADKTISELESLGDELNELTLAEVLNPVPTRLQSIADTKIKDLNDAINGIYLGEILENTRNEILDVSAYTTTIDTSVKYLVDGTDVKIAICDEDVWYEGAKTCDFDFTYTGSEHTHSRSCFDFVWRNNSGDELTGVMKNLASVKIGELTGTTIQDKIQNITIGDIITIDETDPNTSKLLISLKNKKVGELSTVIDTLTLGEIVTIDSSSPQILKALSDCTIGNIGTKVDELKLSEIVTIDSSSPKILTALKDCTLNDIGSKVNDLTLGEVVDTSTNAILSELSGTKITEIGDKINDVYVGTAMNYLRKEKSDETTVDAFGTSTTAFNGSDGKVYILQGEKYYYAETTCGLSHTHTAECYEVVWYTETNSEGPTTPASGITKAFVNCKINEISSVMDTLTLRKLDIGSDNNILKSLQDVPIAELSNHLNDMKMGLILGYERQEISDLSTFTDLVEGVKTDGTTIAMLDEGTYYKAELNCEEAHTVHNSACYGFVWYEKCTSECAHATTDDVITLGTDKYHKINGLYEKIANKTSSAISNGGMKEILDSLTMAELIDSGMMEISVDDEYKMALIYCNKDTTAYKATIPCERTISGSKVTQDMEFNGNLQGYLYYTNLNEGTDLTSKEFFEKTHESLSSTERDLHRDLWKQQKLDDFISNLLSAI